MPVNKRNAKHIAIQKAGKIRDRFTCQVCGSTDSPEGHHIINYQYGGAADVENIITLCQKCHKAVHRGELDIILF